jgi:hypothetical protein
MQSPMGAMILKRSIYLSHQEKTNVRGDLGTLEIYHESSVKIRPDHLFLTFTTIEHFQAPDLPYFSPYII